MIAAVALAAYACILGTVGADRLRQAHWPERAPRLAIMAWQVLTGAVLGSVVLAGLVLALPTWPVGRGGLAALLHTCTKLLGERYSTPGGAVSGGLGLFLALGVLARTAYCAAVSLGAVRAGRSQQRSELALVARSDQTLGMLVLDHPTCAAYCVPGRGGRVVITSGALASLDADQVAAVSAHERAHLRGHHDWVIQAAAILKAGFPFVPAFRASLAEVGRLTEMLADDESCRVRDPLTLATALSKLAESSAPLGALGAGGSTAVVRVRRLALPSVPLRWKAKALTGVGLALLATAPLVLAASPVLGVVSASYCPISGAS